MANIIKPIEDGSLRTNVLMKMKRPDKENEEGNNVKYMHKRKPISFLGVSPQKYSIKLY